MAIKVYDEILNVYISKSLPMDTNKNDYVLLIKSEEEKTNLPPSMQMQKYENFGVGIIDIR